MSTPETALSYWSNFARRFHAVGPPFAPSMEDVSMMEAVVGGLARANDGDGLRVLLLGVTPRIARMKLPQSSSLLAVDRSEAMVRYVWPSDAGLGRTAVVGEWFDLPAGDASQDVVIGDGVPICVRYPGHLRQLACSTRRVVRADGVVLWRCFVQRESPEDPGDVMDQIAACPSFHLFKMRLLMALQRNSRDGIAVNDVYRYWISRNIDVNELAARTGWDRRDIETIELHNGPNTVHTFPTLAEIQELVAPCFRSVSAHVPRYCMGESCPLLVMRP